MLIPLVILSQFIDDRTPIDILATIYHSLLDENLTNDLERPSAGADMVIIEVLLGVAGRLEPRFPVSGTFSSVESVDTGIVVAVEVPVDVVLSELDTAAGPLFFLEGTNNAPTLVAADIEGSGVVGLLLCSFWQSERTPF